MEKILLIDDDLDMRELISDTLRDELLVEVLEADSVESALTMISEHKPEAIICDYNLGKLNGLDLYEKVKSNDIPFILLTGQIFENDNEAFKDFQNGKRSKLMQKPVTDEEIITDLKLLV